jgi:hypothetical protein
MFCHMRHACKLLVLAACIGAAGSAAQAADNTRYISITGSNANACTLALPCRTLHKGISVTPAGGELQILDSGFYGNNATINKSLTISGNGHTVYLGVPLTVDSAGAVVALRGLTLDGQGTILRGIHILDAAAVHIERCVIHGYTEYGIRATAADLKLFVLDTTARDNANGLGFSHGRLTVDNSHFDNNVTDGIDVIGDGGDATIRRATASGNGGRGIVAINSPVRITSTVAAHNGNFGLFATGVTNLTLESSAAYANGEAGLFVGSLAIALISHSTFTGNVVGINNGGVIRTLVNNVVDGNFNDNVAGIVQPITPF